jgi:hypothetical protein
MGRVVPTTVRDYVCIQQSATQSAQDTQHTRKGTHLFPSSPYSQSIVCVPLSFLPYSFTHNITHAIKFVLFVNFIFILQKNKQRNDIIQLNV